MGGDVEIRMDPIAEEMTGLADSPRAKSSARAVGHATVPGDATNSERRGTVATSLALGRGGKQSYRGALQKSGLREVRERVHHFLFKKGTLKKPKCKQNRKTAKFVQPNQRFSPPRPTREGKIWSPAYSLFLFPLPNRVFQVH